MPVCFRPFGALALLAACFSLFFATTAHAQRGHKGSRYCTSPGSAQPPLRIAKAMLLPAFIVNNASLGYEWQRGTRSTWSLVGGAAAGFHTVSVGTYSRAAVRAEHRWYVFQLPATRSRAMQTNPYVAPFVGASYHQDSNTDDESGLSAHRSGHVGLAVGQQLFMKGMILDLAVGARAHSGAERFGQGRTWRTDWQAGQWASPMLHFQVGYVLGRGSKHRGKR